VANFFDFLTDEDEQRLLGGAELRSVDPDGVIVKQGELQGAIFVLKDGEARVERSHGEFNVEISRLTAGNVFGEMGFIEGFEASASVIAETACEVHVIDVNDVEALIRDDPGFYGRFYQALAYTLSERLRETTVDGIADFSWGSGFMGQESDAEAGVKSGWGGGSPFEDPPSD
jgi:CRP-like cAMP-binding protein